MANYLVVETDAELIHVTEVEGKHIAEALESLKLEDGQSVIVYRVAARRKVTVKHKTVRQLDIQ